MDLTGRIIRVGTSKGRGGSEMHGGDIYRNQVHMDFSVNVNPLGMPESVKEALLKGIALASTYPDPQCEKLRGKLAEHFGIDKEVILCGNGASELLMAICNARRPGSALLLAPGFSGYQKALEAVGCTADFFFLREEETFGMGRMRFESFLREIRIGKPEILFMANPSNPVGTLWDADQMAELAKCCEEYGTLLVLDECFMELTSHAGTHSMVDRLAQFPNLLILRAFTKSFAIPGIRLGYLLCPDKKIAAKIAGFLPEWNVSVPAQMAGIAALEEKEYLLKAGDMIRKQRSLLTAELEKLGARVYPSEANFLLFRWETCGSEKSRLQKILLEDGILIRDCSDYPGLDKGYYRVAVKTPEENRRLIASLRKVCR